MLACRWVVLGLGLSRANRAYGVKELRGFDIPVSVRFQDRGRFSPFSNHHGKPASPTCGKEVVDR